MSKLAFHCLLSRFSALRRTKTKPCPWSKIFCFHVCWNKLVRGKCQLCRISKGVQNKYKIFQALNVCKQSELLGRSGTFASASKRVFIAFRLGTRLFRPQSGAGLHYFREWPNFFLVNRDFIRSREP